MNLANFSGLISESMNADPQSWRSFFTKYGLNTYRKPEKEIIRAYKMYGKPVLTDLNNLFVETNKNIVQFNGGTIRHAWDTDSTAKANATLDALGAIVGAVDVFTCGKTNTPQTTPEQAAEQTPKTGNEPATEPEAPKTENKTLYIFAGVVVVAIVAFFIIKRKK